MELSRYFKKLVYFGFMQDDTRKNVTSAWSFHLIYFCQLHHQTREPNPTPQPLSLVSSGEAECCSSELVTPTIPHNKPSLSFKHTQCLHSNVFPSYAPLGLPILEHPWALRRSVPTQRFTTTCSHLSIFHVCQDKKRLGTHLELRNFLVLSP